jgi:hypothetical protein
MVCSLVSPAFAAGGQTGILSGTVTDNATQQPIANASITAASPSGSYNATTDGHGTFTIVGVNVDTYVVSVAAPGYDTYVLHAATVNGDQTLQLPLLLSRQTTVIGRVGARSASGAFQPSQTVDSYTLTGARLDETTGSPADSNLNDIVLSAPGVALTDAGLPTIRGGSEREIGYQFDGVSFAEPFLGANGSNGLFNGLGSVQVVEGVGDASQGGLGAGVINVIPKRGTNPPFGSVTLQAGSPNFNNFAGGEYGFATADGSISNYISMTNNRYVPYYGYHNQDAASYGNYFNFGFRNNTQFLDNFVFKFGAEKNQSLQVLYTNLSELYYGDYGGIPPGGLPYYNYDTLTGPGYPAFYQYIAPTPYTSATNATTPELQRTVNTEFLKVEYDNNLNSSTYLALRYFNWDRVETDQNLYELGPFQQGQADFLQEGGPTAGMSFDLTHTFNDKLTVTLQGSYQDQLPLYSDYQPGYALFGAPIGDFEPPTAPCAGVPLGDGYVSCAYGNGVIQAPTIEYTERARIQDYGTGLRFQYSPTTKLHTDFGIRYEGQNQHWTNPFNTDPATNPYDVPAALWTAQIITPKVISPRIAIDYEIDKNDAFRASYGRSAVFQNAQNSGTPFGLVGNIAALAALPPDLVGVTPLLPGAPLANQCGTTLAGLAGLFPCANYADQFYWLMDRGFDAPDAGGVQPSVYNNYDASFSHQFGNGLAFKLTPFYKLGTNLPTSILLLTLPGGSQIFSGGSKGFNRTTGVEFGVTQDRPIGLAFFISGTYQNVLQSAPPLSNGEFNGVPQLSAADANLGNVYRAGYVPPASVRIGGTYNMRNGFSITPTVQINSGYPYNVGDTIASTLSDGTYANIPQVNFGPATPILLGYQNAGGNLLNTNYADPAYSGPQLAPNIAATRGTPTSSHSGGVTWDANVQLNVTLQYKRGKDTFGLEMVNVGTNGYNNTTPAVNPFYQPVGNGTSGPQTGQNTCVSNGGYGTARGCADIPVNTYAFTNGAYLLTNGNVGDWQLAPLAPMSFNLFYRRQF